MRRAGLPRRGESRFLRPMQKESLIFKQRSGRRSPRAAPARNRSSHGKRHRARAWGARGRSPVPMPRAGNFDCAPRIPGDKAARAVHARAWRSGASLRPPRPCLRGPLGGRCGPSRAACWRWSLAVRAVGVCCGCSSCSAGSGGVAGGSGGAAGRRGAVAAWCGGGGGAAAVGGAGGVAAVAGLRRLRAGVGRRRRLGRGLRCGAALFGALSLLSAPRTETHPFGTQHREPKPTPSGRSHVKAGVENAPLSLRIGRSDEFAAWVREFLHDGHRA